MTRREMLSKLLGPYTKKSINGASSKIIQPDAFTKPDAGELTKLINQIETMYTNEILMAVGFVYEGISKQIEEGIAFDDVDSGPIIGELVKQFALKVPEQVEK